MDQHGERKQRKRLATTSRWIIAGLAGSAAALVALHAGRLIAAAPVVFPPPARPMGSLKTVPVPGPTEQELAVFVRDRKAAIQLGKALFWDMRVGSDNLTACASCHFQAGADNRITNQINPGLLAGDNQFNTGSAKQVGPNYKLRAADFPLVRHGDVDDAGTIIADNNDVVGSQGVFAATYDDIKPNGRKDDCTNISDSLMHGGTGFDVNGVNVRRVTGRNAPSVINAVFNFRNFWDGRANNVFNGGDPFGMRNPQPLVWKLEGSVLRNVPVRLSSSSLASQASGPPMSNVEMSCAGRAFIDLGKRLLDETILRAQTISPKDSVLGGFAANAPTYSQLVRKAFQPAFWEYAGQLTLPGAQPLNFRNMDLPRMRRDDERARDKLPKPGKLVTTQMEANFALFFGIAVQLYESTLVSDDTPFDRYADGDRTALTAQQLRGMKIFQEQGKCLGCHSGQEFTNASYANVQSQRVERMTMGDGGVGVYDSGFYNIGVRPTSEDMGLGGTDPFGNPLSETRMVMQGKTALLGNNFGSGVAQSWPAGARDIADGAFKAPALRNVEFTGPYFHNGGAATLMQVVDFYNRGGDYAYANRKDLDFNISPIGLSQAEKEDLVAFLLSLSDERVRLRRAPFDHPSLCVPDGALGGTKSIAQHGRSGHGVDDMVCLDEVGANGTKRGLKTFLELSPFAR
ncbi:cytochrome-c peroxidase [Cupriavidus basilensis]|uniref:Cytochrome-c peroxidase n=1 Tax=Cupriavidus basilensis TaxID=68895 RepID=A0A643FLM7_9BURK|nr:cytochrome c peroxidase [Cupriavidus basilensis]QOT79436.1 cytochrome-c peroxidase [Cupriavidus basilensis]